MPIYCLLLALSTMGHSLTSPVVVASSNVSVGNIPTPLPYDASGKPALPVKSEDIRDLLEKILIEMKMQTSILLSLIDMAGKNAAVSESK